MIWKVRLLAVLLGATSVVSFAPFEIAPLSVICISGLLLLSLTADPNNAFKSGFCFGFGMYSAGVSWVYISLSTYGGMPLWMGMISVIGFASLMALFVAITNYFARLFAGNNERLYLIVFPFIWVLFEWTKSWVFSGFPWLDIGYSQTGTWLAGWAPIGGIYLVGFWVVVLAALLVLLVTQRAWFSVFPVLLVLFFSWSLSSVAWTSPLGKPVNIGVVQANIPIEGKWSPKNQQRALQQYRQSSIELSQLSQTDIIVWPETALPLYLSQTDVDFWNRMVPEGVDLITGLLDHDQSNSYNAAILSCSGSRDAPQVYRKRHLVPFGEYQPFQLLFGWVFEYLQLPMSEFSSWGGVQQLKCESGVGIGLSICYEDAFSNEYRAFLGDANILVNISEDAWFGDSLAPHQRRQMAQMRALELGRPMIRSANSGPSLFIDEFGDIAKITPQFESAVASQFVQPMRGSTPFMQLGSWIIWLSLFLFMALLARYAAQFRG
ncbi:MAG: apolipoprotein N-acyltransferase [Gammaproteobacteria bacterium]|nr:apolipoprotein N-acyltransferase [Gammaproteobacteria bacterium]